MGLRTAPWGQEVNKMRADRSGLLESPTTRIARLVGANYLPPYWVWLTEVRTKTGWSSTWGDDLDSERYIDGFAFALIPSKNFQRIAYEFKVSRSDWLAELKNPVKKAPAYFLSHQFWYVVLPGVIDIKNDFKPKYIIIPKSRKVIKFLKDLVKETRVIILATDEDREGEAIAWHLSQVLKLDGENP